MKNNILLTLFLFSIAFAAKAQFTVTGQLRDTINEPVPQATVMLLGVKDSALVNFTSTDAKGNFSFKNIKKSEYILKTSHFTYMPQQIHIQPAEEKEVNLGVIIMKPIAHFLMEVVIREARAPIFIKGDTVEYDATTFKVPPGSTVEDLLRRLPGIDVDAEGNISTMGKDVKTVYVDGKNFFGNDPKTVTQNLDAQAVSKVQVFTEKSEQEKLTGISDGSKEKVMNLELKDEYKKGYFGKMSAGYGWGKNAPHRWLAKGSFNWFTDKQQLSFIGFGNNLNQSNYNWSDMQEFKGQSMQAGSDNGDFGFKGNWSGMRGYSFGFYGSDGSGFSNNGGGGVNYNYYDKKVKFNVGYLYTVNQTFSDVLAERQTFLSDSSFLRLDSTHNNNLRQNHNFSTRFEYQIDSTNTIIFRANVGYVPNNRSNFTNQLYKTPEWTDINQLTVNNKFRNDNLNFNFLTIYNHKFKKKRRSFSISGFYYYTDVNNMEDINNINEFLNLNTEHERIQFLVKNNKNSEDHTVKSSVMYVEPLGKRFSLLSFYNFRYTLSRNKNNSKEPQANVEIDSLWLNYQNNMFYNRVGTSLVYEYKGIEINLGGAYQSMILKGISETRLKPAEIFKATSYHNFIPNFSAHFQLPKNIYISTSYSYDVSEPEISYLFPMPNLTNTMYKILGNPNLQPERSHEIDASFNYRDNASMISLRWSVDAEFYENQIIYNQRTEFAENQGYITISEPKNLNGGNRFSSHIWSSIPLVKTILTMNINASGSIGKSPVFINDIENLTRSQRYYAGISFNITVKQRLTFSTGANISQNFTKYSIQKDRNQNSLNLSAYLNVKWQVFKKTFLEGGYTYINYTNKFFTASNRNLHKLNVSVRQVIGKKNQWELRAAAVDILNANQFINYAARLNYTEYRTAPTLARYFFLTVSYNLKGFEVKNVTNTRMRTRTRVVNQ